MAIIATEKVLTLDYWKPAAKLEVGDIVFNQLGNPVTITLVQQYRSDACYLVRFNDYLQVCGDLKLTFPTENKKYRNRIYSYKGRFKFKRPLKPVPVEDLKDRQLVGVPTFDKLSVPTAHPLKLPIQDLPIPPFVFGYWFFNQKANNKYTFTKNRQEDITTRFKDVGYNVTPGKMTTNRERYFKIFPSVESQLIGNIPNRIPNNYLLASDEQRIELLRGILASRSRQYTKKIDSFRITNANYAIIKQIQFLVESLGCRTKLVYTPQKNSYTCFFKSRLSLVPEQRTMPLKVHHGRRYFMEVEQIASQMCVYIETDGESNPILVGEGLIPCH